MYYVKYHTTNLLNSQSIVKYKNKLASLESKKLSSRKKLFYSRITIFVSTFLEKDAAIYEFWR